MLPLGCLPLREREGITLPAAAENKRILGKSGFQQSRFFPKPEFQPLKLWKS